MIRPTSRVPVLLATGLIGLLAVARAGTITVSPGGVLTIQDAIDQSSDGDTVELLDGAYTGPGNRDLDFAGRAITLRSASGDPQLCILDVQGSDHDPHRGIHFASGEGPDTIVEGLTITGGHDAWSGGIYAEVYTSPTIRNCRLIANQGSEGAGLCTKDAATIEDCWFEANVSSAHGGGASAAGNLGWSSTFTRCTFVRNTAGQYGGAFRC